MRIQTVFGTRVVLAIGLMVLLGACQHAPPTRLPEPELQLLEASPLEIPRDCVVSGSFVVSFTVATSGRTNSIHAPGAPLCVEQALTAWVESFRYVAPSRAIPTSVEWMMVTGKRGS